MFHLGFCHRVFVFSLFSFLTGMSFEESEARGISFFWISYISVWFILEDVCSYLALRSGIWAWNHLVRGVRPTKKTSGTRS